MLVVAVLVLVKFVRLGLKLQWNYDTYFHYKLMGTEFFHRQETSPRGTQRYVVFVLRVLFV